uniref:Uncharacterized protein TCIL3000_11_11120 n=1 Tax=Trypanosoma congolense (strain IL3000) TaxID=1068625 RepID=G0V1V6_TRYCI|nr:unnamed protein product [Trypanosoma congolense IL3000]
MKKVRGAPSDVTARSSSPSEHHQALRRSKWCDDPEGADARVAAPQHRKWHVNRVPRRIRGSSRNFLQQRLNSCSTPRFSEGARLFSAFLATPRELSKFLEKFSPPQQSHGVPKRQVGCGLLASSQSALRSHGTPDFVSKDSGGNTSAPLCEKDETGALLVAHLLYASVRRTSSVCTLVRSSGCVLVRHSQIFVRCYLPLCLSVDAFEYA